MLTAFVGTAHGAVDDPGDHFVVRSDKGNTSFTATITSDDHGIWVDVHGEESSPGQSAAPAPAAAAPASPAAASAPPPQQAPAGPTIARSWYDPVRGYFSETSDGHVNSLEGIPITSVASAPGNWENVGAQQHPGTVPMAFNVDGQLQDIVWVPYPNNNVNWGPPQTTPPNSIINGGGGTDPHQVALDLLAHIPLPTIQLKENPALGMVAVPGWFWVANYDGAPFGASRTVTLPPPAPGAPPTAFTVTVRVWPAEYDWLFGDGGSLTTHSLGQPYPQKSDVQHTYQYSSFRFPGGYPVDLTVHFDAQYQVNGGGPQPLPPIVHTYDSAYPVQQAQALLSTPKAP